MTFFIKTILYATAILSLVSCSNMNNVANQPQQSGISQRFQAPAQQVNLALLATLHSINVNIKDSRNTPQGFRVLFTKSVSAFSWGEVGRILVVKVDQNNSQVFIHSLKRSSLQITGAEETDFSSVIFAGIAQKLGVKNP